MKVGMVSLWLLLLLSEKPMYGYEIIRELEKRFSGYWKPKTGTIYPALEKLETDKLVTSKVEFRDEGVDRRHYALTDRGKDNLSQAVKYWTKMFEVVERHRETHQSIFRHESQPTREELSRILVDLGKSLKTGTTDLAQVMPSNKKVVAKTTEPFDFKFLYAKEDHEQEFHMAIKWKPKESK